MIERIFLKIWSCNGRYGGEEFLIIAPGCSWNEAVILAERIRSSISAEPVNTQSGVIHVTMSLGVTIGGDRIGEDAATLIAAADEALYRAKKAGRNRVEFSDRRVWLIVNKMLI